MRKWLVILPALAGLGVLGYLLFTGPRMKEQENIRAFQARMPLPPKGALPLEEAYAPVPTTQQAAGMKNPLPASAPTIARGRVYYGYYCAFCHNDNGDGNGPVGRSYVPPPPDLRKAHYRSFTDGQFYKVMLSGVGHEPVMQRVIRPEHRWYLVAYVRSLAE